MAPVAQFAALADATRCRVVELLGERPRAVHELAATFAISRPAISRHLKVLKDAGLVREEKQGRQNVYSLRRARFRPAADWLNRQWNTRLAPKPAVKASADVPQMAFDI